MKVVYIAHPLRGDIEANLASARRYCHAAVAAGYAPIAPYLEGYLHEDVPGDRELGLGVDFAVIPRVDELWLCGERLSDGMAAEARAAYEAGVAFFKVVLRDGDLSFESALEFTAP